MQGGLAKVDITPQVGVDLTGYSARLEPSTGIHDRLFCRALVLSDGVTEAALVECDTLGFGLEYTRQVKRLIEEQVAIPAANVMVAATHTHSGPASVFLRHCGELPLDWLAEFPGKTVEAVRQVTTQAQIEWAACWLVMMSGHRVDSSYATDCDP